MTVKINVKPALFSLSDSPARSCDKKKKKNMSCNQKYGLFACVNVGKITTILYIFFFVRFLLSILSKGRSLSFIHENLILVGCPLYHGCIILLKFCTILMV